MSSSKTDIEFAKILDHVAAGEVTDGDFHTLSQRRLDILDRAEQNINIT